MDNHQEPRFEDKTIPVGLVLLVFSFLVFTGTVNVYDLDFDIFSGAFFVNFALTFIYFIIVVTANKNDTGRLFRFPSFARNVVLLQLFNISAYSLNRSIPVFQISANWVVWFLMLSNALLLVHVLWRNFNNNWLNHLLVMVSTAAIFFHFYESIYVAPGYVVGVLACWFFGIPLHIFVPALFVWVYTKVVRSFLNKSSEFWSSALVAGVLSLVIMAFVSFRFHGVNQSIHAAFHASNEAYSEQHLPDWVTISQNLRKDWVTERALKCGLVYSSADNITGRFRGSSLNERVKHDPLVVIASFFAGKIDIRHDDRIKILQYMYDMRHQTERKLWSGDNLSTSDIVTNVQLFPEYRLAYTEKTFKIHNSQVERWQRQQEALYTFYLPEGSVVTSAALWVNGKAEPAYLTTKSKADSAYQRIVGRERRDPLLLHWQEGNRVTVRVFPCTPDEDRQFKIGVTTPLQKQGEELRYENIDFQGPYWKGATESINVVTEGELTNLSTPLLFKEKGTAHNYVGPYKSDWKLTFDAPTLATQPFVFNNKSYQLSAYQKETEAFVTKDIYLDINAAWTKKELNTVWENKGDKNIYVFANHRIQKVNSSNKKALFKHLLRQNYTLFPFYKIENPGQSLVISKYNQLTPTLKDLKNTTFATKTNAFFNANEAPLRVYHLDTEMSPYLRTLKEIRAIQAETGDITTLATLLQNNTFYKNPETDNQIVNRYANFQITEQTDVPQTKSDAPNHLMRLFAYNDLLRTIGKDYFNSKGLENHLIEQAKESYVVTPISSLVVLETQKDYERFDIKKSKNSLQNASIGNSGAVPEPHEWLLIIMVLLTTLYLYWKR